MNFRKYIDSNQIALIAAASICVFSISLAILLKPMSWPYWIMIIVVFFQFFVSFWIVLLTLPFFVPFRVVIFMLLGYIIFGVVFWQKEKKKEKDLITFGDTKIIIESKTICTIDYKDIKKISLSFRSTTSKNWFSLRLIFRPPNFGDSNTLKIEKKDSQVIKKDIWCEVDADYWRLKRIGKFLKEKGVDVKMKGFFRHYK